MTKTKANQVEVARSAVLSDCERYRFMLSRVWKAPAERVLFFVGLNPSRADAFADDPTVRRLIGFARRLGYDGLDLANLFAWRSPSPRELRRVPTEEVVGNPTCDEWIEASAKRASMIVACWGEGSISDARIEAVVAILRRYRDVHALGLTKYGGPRHPLYLPATSEPVVWKRKASAS